MALGVLASYATNVTGSAFVGQWWRSTAQSPLPKSLGSKRHRDLGQSEFGNTRPADHGGARGFGASASAASLPADISATLTTALGVAYPGTPPPDLELGLRRLVRHVELLATFNRPALPEPPDQALAPLLTTLTATSGTSLHPLTEDPYGTGEPDPTSGSGTPTTSDSKDSTGTVCVAIIFAAVIAVVVAIDCVVQLIDHGDCDPGDTLEEIFGGDDEPEEVTTDGQLLTIASSSAGANLVQQLFQLQMMLWQAFDQAFSYLAVTGLIYPDALLMGSPLYSQFTSVPNRPDWPCRSIQLPKALPRLSRNPSSFRRRQLRPMGTGPSRMSYQPWFRVARDGRWPCGIRLEPSGARSAG